MTTFIGLFFGVIIIVGLFAMVKIQREEYFAARAEKDKREARLAAFRGKCHRPDGD